MDSERILEKTKQKPIHTSDQIFKWRFNSTAEFTRATHTDMTLWRDDISGKSYWIWEAWTGSYETKDIFFYQITLPYVDESPIDHTYKLGEGGLVFEHAFSTANDQLKVVKPESATVYIKLDPKTGISEGTFDASFLGIHKSPQGKFALTRNIP